MSSWLFTDEALQQASAAPVVRHRAQSHRGRGAPVRLVGSGIDPVGLAMARHNLGATADLCRADGLHPVTRDSVVLADPARRSGGRRRFNRCGKPAYGRRVWPSPVCGVVPASWTAATRSPRALAALDCGAFGDPGPWGGRRSRCATAAAGPPWQPIVEGGHHPRLGSGTAARGRALVCRPSS